VRVAYAIGRGMGNAVSRNRARRRLRAAVSHLAPELPSGAYLIGATPAATTVPFAELEQALADAVHAATTGTRS
jgi:ribonuclease P protein component